MLPFDVQFFSFPPPRSSKIIFFHSPEGGGGNSEKLYTPGFLTCNVVPGIQTSVIIYPQGPPRQPELKTFEFKSFSNLTESVPPPDNENKGVQHNPT